MIRHLSPAHIVAIVAVLIAYAIWFRACRRLRLLGQLHHIHYAVPLLALRWWPCWIVAGVLALDDAMQHELQLVQPTYLSPLHLAWARVACWMSAQLWIPRPVREWVVR